MLNPSIPLVETRHGKIVGVVQEEIHIWRGIPYAAPPIGSYAGVRRSLLRPARRAPCGLFLLRQLAGYYPVSRTRRRRSGKFF